MTVDPAATRDGQLIYMAGPCDGVDDLMRYGWRLDAAERIRSMGSVAFSPPHAFPFSDRRAATQIRRANRAIIDVCDGLLVHMPKAGAKIGTIREIEYAKERGKHVAIFCPDGDVADLLGSYETYDVDVCSTMVEAIHALIDDVPF